MAADSAAAFARARAFAASALASFAATRRALSLSPLTGSRPYSMRVRRRAALITAPLLLACGSPIRVPPGLWWELDGAQAILPHCISLAWVGRTQCTETRSGFEFLEARCGHWDVCLYHGLHAISTNVTDPQRCSQQKPHTKSLYTHKLDTINCSRLDGLVDSMPFTPPFTAQTRPGGQRVTVYASAIHWTVGRPLLCPCSRAT